MSYTGVGQISVQSGALLLKVSLGGLCYSYFEERNPKKAKGWSAAAGLCSYHSSLANTFHSVYLTKIN